MPHRHSLNIPRQFARPHDPGVHSAALPQPASGLAPDASGPAAPGPGSLAPQAPPADILPTPDATQRPACAQPDVAAATLAAVVPDTPPLAQAQGISGDVTVLVSLDESSRVTGARVVTSPSTLLNDAALRAARASTFRTEVRHCRPIAADYAFIVEFTSQ